MSGTKGGTKKQADKARASMLSLLNDFDPNHLVLPLDEIRLLALLVSTRDGVGPFVRRMMLLSEALKAGRTSRASQLARRSGDQSLTELLLPMARAIERGASSRFAILPSAPRVLPTTIALIIYETC